MAATPLAPHGSPATIEPTAITALITGQNMYVERVDRSHELADASVRDDLLRELAEGTGGELRSLDQRGDSLPLRAERRERVESSQVLPLWRTWWAFAAVAGLACTEWWLRRRWGLA